MKKLYLFMLFAMLASFGFANAAAVTIWEEDFSAEDCMNAYTVTGNTKTYDENLAKGDAAPELLISKNNGSFAVNLTDLKGASGELKLTYKSNKYGYVTVSSTTANVTVGETTYEGSAAPYVNTTLITIPEGLTSLNLTFTNSSSKNARYDDFLLVKEEASADDVQSPGIGLFGYPLDPDSEDDVFYGDVDVNVYKADDAESIHVVVSKDGVEIDNATATADWEKTYSELGKYTVSATATNGEKTSEPTEMEFEIVPEPVLNAPTFSLAEGTYTGTQIVTIEGYEGSMIVGTCNGEDVYDYSPCDVTLAAPASGETTYVVTVHAELGEKQSEESTATYVIKAGEPAAEGAFTLATSADMLKEGASVIFVSGEAAMSTTQNVKDLAKQFRQSTSVTVVGNTVPAVGADVAVFTVGKDGDNYTFYNAATKTETGSAMPGYLCAVSSDKNALGVETNLSDNGKWSLEFTDGKVKMLAQGEFTRNLLQFNYNGFRCYNPATTSVDTPLAIYCQVESGVNDVAADGVKVIAGEGTVRIVADSARAAVYTMAGQTVAVADVDGEATIRLAAGFYIVRVGDAAFKVIVK